MKHIDVKKVELLRDIDKEHKEKMLDDPVYENVMLLIKELTKKSFIISNSRFPNIKKNITAEKITTNYRPGTSLKNKYIIFLNNKKEVLRLNIPNEIRVKGKRFTLEYSDESEEKILKKSFKNKEIEDLKVYIDIL